MFKRYNYDTFLETDQYYQSRIQSQDNFDYASAQSYYKKQKKAMLDQLVSQTQKDMTTKMAKRLTNELETQILATANEAALDSSIALEKAENALQEVVQLAQNSNINIGLQKSLEKAVQVAQNSLIKSRAEYKSFDRYFMQLVRKYLSDEANQEIEKMLKTTSIFNGASSLVQANMRNYLLRNLINTTSLFQGKNSQLNTAAKNYARTIGGYFKEEAIVEAFNKASNKIKSSSRKTPQIVNIASQNLPSDFIFNTIVDEEEILKLCEEEYIGQAPINRTITQGVEQAILSGAQVFGAQIKSYSLMDTNGKLTRNYFPIGTRTSLSTKLKSSHKYLYGYSMAANMAFMGQKHNILLALGIQNIMFIAGSKAYWMDEFIEAFRRQGLYLSLDTKGKTLESFSLTAHVSLLKYTNSLMYKMFEENRNILYPSLDKLKKL